MSDPTSLATVELLGALTYAQMRAFDTTASAVRHAPEIRAAERVCGFAAREYEAYRSLRARLDELTDLPEAAMARQKARADAFFDGLPIDDWWSACTFFAIGLPMAADFAVAIAPALDDDTADVVTYALADRDDFAEYAIDEVVHALEVQPQRVEDTRRLAAEITGGAFTAFQGAVTDTDALLVLLEALDEEEDRVRTTAVSILDKHRRRMHAIGVDTPE